MVSYLKPVVYQPLQVVMTSEPTEPRRERLTPLQQRAWDILDEINRLRKDHEKYQYGTDLNAANNKLRKMSRLYTIVQGCLWNDDAQIRAITPFRYQRECQDLKEYLGAFSFKGNAPEEIKATTTQRKERFTVLYSELRVVMTELLEAVKDDPVIQSLGQYALTQGLTK